MDVHAVPYIIIPDFGSLALHLGKELPQIAEQHLLTGWVKPDLLEEGVHAYAEVGVLLQVEVEIIPP